MRKLKYMKIEPSVSEIKMGVQPNLLLNFLIEYSLVLKTYKGAV
jgi:hypothetical protein